MKYLAGSKVYNKKIGTIHTVKDYPIHEAWEGYFTTEEESGKAFHDSDFCLVPSFEYFCIINTKNIQVVIGLIILIYFIVKCMQLFYV